MSKSLQKLGGANKCIMKEERRLENYKSHLKGTVGSIEGPRMVLDLESLGMSFVA